MSSSVSNIFLAIFHVKLNRRCNIACVGCRRFWRDHPGMPSVPFQERVAGQFQEAVPLSSPIPSREQVELVAGSGDASILVGPLPR